MGYSDDSGSAHIWGLLASSSGCPDPSCSGFRLDCPISPVLCEGNQTSIGNFTLTQLRTEFFPRLELGSMRKLSLTSDRHSSISSVDCNPSFKQVIGSSAHSPSKPAGLHNSSIAAENSSEEKVNCIESNMQMDLQMVCVSTYNCSMPENEVQNAKNQHQDLNSSRLVSMKELSDATPSNGASNAKKPHKMCMFDRCRKRPRGDSDLCIVHSDGKRWPKQECNISTDASIAGQGSSRRWRQSLGHCHHDGCTVGAARAKVECCADHGESMFGGAAICSTSVRDGTLSYRAGATNPRAEYFIAAKGMIDCHAAAEKFVRLENDCKIAERDVDACNTQGFSDCSCNQDSSIHSFDDKLWAYFTGSCHKNEKGLLDLSVLRSALAEDQRVHGSFTFDGTDSVRCKLSVEIMQEDRKFTSSHPTHRPDVVNDVKFSSESSSCRKQNHIQNDTCHRSELSSFSSILAGVPNESLKLDTTLEISNVQHGISCTASIFNSRVSSWHIFGQSPVVSYTSHRKYSFEDDSIFNMSSLILPEERVHGGNIMAFLRETSD